MRRLAAALISLTLVTAACSSEDPMVQSTAPTGNTGLAFSYTPDPNDATRIEGLIQVLFGTSGGGCNGNCNAALTRFQQIEELYTVPPPYNFDAVQSHTYDLIGYILDKFHSQSLNDPPLNESPLYYSGTTKAAVTELVSLLFKYSALGDGSTVCDFAADCDATLYQPGSPAQILSSPLGRAGVSLPPGDVTVDEPTLITVNFGPNQANPLLTALDQYGYFYVFASSSGQGMSPSYPFKTAVDVQVCLDPATAPTGAVLGRLALGHNVEGTTPPTFEILPPGIGFFLTACDLSLASRSAPSLYQDFALRGWKALTGRIATVFSPTPLQAAVAVGTGTTGSTKTFSPFGAVDPLVHMSAASAINQNAPISAAVADPPAVKFETEKGFPVDGINVDFSVTSGLGSISPTTQLTSGTDGTAALTSWTLGPSVGANTVRAVASGPSASLTITPTSIDFSANGYQPVSVTTSSLPDAWKGVSYSATLAASGGGNSYTWDLVTGTPPAGILLGPTGILSGTPSQVGTSSFEVRATSVGYPPPGTRSLSLTVRNPLDVTLGFVGFPAPVCYAAGATFPVTVAVNDGGGNKILADVPLLMEAVLNNGSTVQVLGATATSSNGVATFNLSISKAGGYQLRVKASPWPVVISQLSDKFKVSPKC